MSRQQVSLLSVPCCSYGLLARKELLYLLTNDMRSLLSYCNRLNVARRGKLMGEVDRVYNHMLAMFPDAKAIKAGGQKAVYHATHPEHGDVAVKIGVCESERALERLKREVELLQGIDSEFYPRHISFHAFDAGEFLMVEEFVKGQLLTDCMDQFASSQAAVGLVKGLCSGLQVLWDMPGSVVHRDIKPDNIIIRPDGRPTILDLGIARFLDRTSLTNPLSPYGPCTPAYSAPEQLTNRKADIDWRTDQFLLGIILVQLLLGGVHPYDPQVVGGGQSIPENILTGNWCALLLSRSVPIPLRDTCFRMLGAEPYMRYRTPESLMADIAAYADGEG